MSGHIGLGKEGIMIGVSRRRGIRAAALTACLSAFLFAGAAEAQPRQIAKPVTQAGIGRPERPQPKPPSFIRRLISIVLGDQLDIPRP